MAFTFDANDFNVTLNRGLICLGADTKTVNMGSGKWALTGGSGSHTVNIASSGLTLNEETSTLELGGQDAFTPNSNETLYNLTFSSTFTKTISADIIVANTFDRTASDSLAGGITIFLEGDFLGSVGAGDIKGSTCTIEFSGGNTQDFQTVTAGRLQSPIVINKSGGILTFTGTIGLESAFTHTAGTVDPGTSTVKQVGGTSTNASGMAFYNWQVDLFTVTLTGDMDCNNDLTIPSASSGTLSPGTNMVTVGGTFSRLGTLTASAHTFVFDGPTSSIVQANTFNNLTVDAGGRLALPFQTDSGTVLTGRFVGSGVTANTCSLISSDTSVSAVFQVKGEQDVQFLDVRAIRCLSQTGRAVNGFLHNATNWSRGDLAGGIN